MAATVTAAAGVRWLCSFVVFVRLEAPREFGSSERCTNAHVVIGDLGRAGLAGRGWASLIAGGVVTLGLELPLPLV